MTYRRDRVSPETAKAVFEIDGKCIAPKVDPDAGPCSDKSTLDHVHDEHGVGKRRAPSDIWHLVAVCEGHSERGAKAGHIWNVSHRELERQWLMEHRPPRPQPVQPSGSASSDQER
jgi:hypothetical protein